MAELLSIRAVVFQDRGWWVAQCLEYDLCTSAKVRKELTRRLASQLRLQMIIDLAAGKRPFRDLPQAPQRFWNMYTGGTLDEIVQVRGSWLGALIRLWRGVSQIEATIALASA